MRLFVYAVLVPKGSEDDPKAALKVTDIEKGFKTSRGAYHLQTHTLAHTRRDSCTNASGVERDLSYEELPRCGLAVISVPEVKGTI